MTLRMVGAGLPRTGTKSLKLALERLLGAPCYHMQEFFEHPEHAPLWRDAYRGGTPDWETLLAGYAAGVDTPVCQFWRELAAAYPDAPVLLSRRESAEVWFRSADRTVLAQVRAARAAMDAGGLGAGADGPAWFTESGPEEQAAVAELFRNMGGTMFGSLDDPEIVKAAYERRLAEVRAAIPAGRLVEWQPGDGWEPLCTALGVPVPDEEFPHENTAAEFVARTQNQIGGPGVART